MPITVSCKTPKKYKISTNDMEYMSNIIWDNNKVKKYVEDQIYIQNNILGKIKCAMRQNDVDKKDALVNDIISVGEYKM